LISKGSAFGRLISVGPPWSYSRALRHLQPCERKLLEVTMRAACWPGVGGVSRWDVVLRAVKRAKE
jgi:hypothetical protein